MTLPLLDTGRLLRGLPGVMQSANMWAVYAARLAQSAKLRACVDFLEEVFAQLGPGAAAQEPAGE